MIDAVASTPLAAPRDQARAEAAAKEFEAVFIAQMLAPLFASVETPSIAGGGKSEAFFKGLLQESYAKAVAERGGFGLASEVKAALLDFQTRASAPLAESRP
jgi:Rod binding domain-containing protein